MPKPTTGAMRAIRLLAFGVSEEEYERRALILDKHTRLPALIEALEEITKGKGRFSMDHKQHAINTIEDMKELARAALQDAEGSSDVE